MIKGLAITPPVLGRISIGKVIERNGKRLPEKDDQFTITSQVQSRDGWVAHPIDEELRQAAPNGKLRSIPVRVLFNDPDLNLRAEYSLFDRQNGRPLCVGNGETCKRLTASGMQTLPCPAPESCELAKGQACKPYGRLNVQIGDEDDVGSFIFRTTGFNSIRCLTARLHYYKAVSGNLLACLPLELRLRGKSTTQSHRSAIYYADLTIRDGMSLEAAIQMAKQLHAHRQAGGYMQEDLDQTVREGFANGAFEDSEEDASDIVEEFFNASAVDISITNDLMPSSPETVNASKPKLKPKLMEKLEQRAALLPSAQSN
ncbi:hydrolase or metal-binding protein [Undibacterium jejuense]|uniref:recombination directionality factor n=1 Tax=Undibacterium jejuense TaxID=1344949 RepID=UPI001C9B9530|nr:hydrolase or metal-binding protein [Undibacterium jejuense]